MIDSEWTIIDEDNQTTIGFSGFMDIDVRNEGQALSYPVEKSSFADYNKVQSPLEIRVNLSKQGDDSEIESIINQLDDYQQKAVLLSVSTPSMLYEGMTLESYSYKRTNNQNTCLLVTELVLKEVREVETQVTTTVITKPKNATSSGKVNTCKTQSSEAPKEKYKAII